MIPAIIVLARAYTWRTRTILFLQDGTFFISKEADMLNVIESILAQNAGRDPDRLAMKYASLRKDAFTFLRGTCHLFYQRLPRERIFREAPLAWICGDLHLENFGSYKGDNRLVYFDVNDFDEAALAPCSWDLVRFATSLLVATHEQSQIPLLGRTLAQAFLDAYATALADGKARWIERETADGPVRELLDGLRLRTRRELLDSRTDVVRRTRRIRVDGRKALAVSDKQRGKVQSFMTRFAANQPDPDFFQVLDVARRIAGTGSLGVERYAILVKGKGSPDGNYLLDLKQACPSSLLSRLRTPQPSWSCDAERVVTVQHHSQAVPMAFLNAVSIGRKSFVLRALQPSEDRVAISFRRASLRSTERLVRCMGHLVAWGHLRSSGRSGAAIADEFIAFGREQKWQRKLLSQAESCTAQLLEDWRTYAEAYDAGTFPG
jgi:uncharacterized protein (DUF2252 family)